MHSWNPTTLTKKKVIKSIFYFVRRREMANIYGTNEKDTLEGQNDQFWSIVNGQYVLSPDQPDTFYAYDGNDIVTARDTNDTIYGYGGNDLLQGNGGNDSIYGHSGDDTLKGGGGSDYLSGGSGNDTLIGGTGSDSLRGGSGADIFDYNAVNESPEGSGRDKILDFSWQEGDKIDLSGVDANVFMAGNQAFSSSQLSYDANTHIFTADVIGGSDLEIELVGGAPGFSTTLDVIVGTSDGSFVPG